MSRPRLLAIVGGVLVLALAAAGGVFTWNTLDGDSDERSAVEITDALGPDIGATQEQRGGGSVYVPAQDEAPPSLDFLQDLRRAIENEHLAREAEREAEERRAATASASRVQDTSVAASAIREWGGGQLLLSLPSIGVTAAVSGLGFEAGTRTPAVPNTPWGVGWYNFTDYPGAGGNAVFAGHVSWRTGAPAVFARLGNLGIGDTIYMVLANGTPIAYRVAQSYYVTPYTANIGDIFGATGSEAVTFITCGGTWDPVAQDYSHRLIVRAYRAR